MAAGQQIPVRIGDVVIGVEALQVVGTEATSGRLGKAAHNVTEAFARAQEVIVEIAKSTASVIERAGNAGRPDRMDVEFGLSFSATGGVVMAGVAGEASLRVTLGYDVSRRLVTGQVETGNEVEPAIDPASGQLAGSA